MPEVKLLKTIMGQFSGGKGSIIEVPAYVAKIYVNAGIAERVKPCNCDDCADGEDCPEVTEQAELFTESETAEAKPKRRRRRTPKKDK
jgi:hypothetical protein